MTESNPLGLAHLLASTDAVGRALFVVLLLMSVASWTVMAVQALARWRGRQRGSAFLARFWAAPSLAAAGRELAETAPQEAFGRLALRALEARAHHDTHGAGDARRLAEAGGLHDFVERAIKQGLDEEALRAEHGLTLLATVGATAPFVGLFGTVWGVYHALIGIGSAGSLGTLDQVAGPVGEALVMTGLGLAVAIPAVIAYNVLVRGNRLLAGRLDGFAHQLMSLVATGAALGRGPAEVPLQAPLRVARSAQPA